MVFVFKFEILFIYIYRWCFNRDNINKLLSSSSSLNPRSTFIIFFPLWRHFISFVLITTTAAATTTTMVVCRRFHQSCCCRWMDGWMVWILMWVIGNTKQQQKKIAMSTIFVCVLCLSLSLFLHLSKFYSKLEILQFFFSILCYYFLFDCDKPTHTCTDLCVCIYTMHRGCGNFIFKIFFFLLFLHYMDWLWSSFI